MFQLLTITKWFVIDQFLENSDCNNLSYPIDVNKILYFILVEQKKKRTASIKNLKCLKVHLFALHLVT